MLCTLLEGEGSEKVYVLYTCLNVDNYGRSIRSYHQDCGSHTHVVIEKK